MNRHRVLVVDDEPLNVEYLDQELRDRGYQVETASDGRRALAAVESDPPDLILLDVLMPGLDGIEICRRLKQRDASRLIPIIMMTALSDQESRIRGVEAGADEFLSKPVDDRELFARIRNALRIKSAFDDHRAELRTAVLQLAALGAHDEEIAIVVPNSRNETAFERFELAVAAHGAIVGRCAESPVAIFKSNDLASNASAAVDFAVRADRSIGFGIAVGTALIGAERSDAPTGHEWVIRVDGAVATEAVSAAAAAAGGKVFVGPSMVEHLGTGFRVTRASVAGPTELYEVGVATGGPAALVYELDFPAEFAAMLPEIRSAWGIRDLYVTKSLSGKSGARVLLVDILMSGFSGQAILKLEEIDDLEGNGQVEAERHRRALEVGGAYAAERMPVLLAHHVFDGGTATLSTIAAGGLEFCQAWFRTPYELQLTSAERISYELLANWNENYVLEDGLVTPGAVLERWLDYRLDPVEGRLDAACRDLIDIDPSTPSLFLDGVLYPNPVAFARYGSEITGMPAFRAAIGRTHGDLHGHNVLTSHRRAGAPDYILIDLAFYDDENFLFFDHAYFELAYLLRTRDVAPPARWLELLAGVFEDGPVHVDDIGVIRMVDAIHAGQRRWIQEREPHREAFMATQRLLAQVAVGINFCNKRVSASRKVNAYLYAAVSLREFLKFHGLDWPRTGDVATIRVS